MIPHAVVPVLLQLGVPLGLLLQAPLPLLLALHLHALGVAQVLSHEVLRGARSGLLHLHRRVHQLGRLVLGAQHRLGALLSQARVLIPLQLRALQLLLFQEPPDAQHLFGVRRIRVSLEGAEALFLALLRLDGLRVDPDGPHARVQEAQAPLLVPLA
eukprot:scaffold789_cov261-Pinguiococcus_pyrenoidosus.AAC.2